MRVYDARGTACTDITIQDTPQKKFFSSARITRIYPTCHTHRHTHIPRCLLVDDHIFISLTPPLVNAGALHVTLGL